VVHSPIKSGAATSGRVENAMAKRVWKMDLKEVIF
jgi:hypothetical protein